MNDKELMIDDWYLASNQHSTMDGDYTLEFYPKRLTIDDLIFAKENDWNECDWNEFTKSIPLTSEILEKNGFKQADAFRKGYGYDFPSQYIEDMYPIYLRTNGIWNIQCAELIDIKYVHELQHTLRLCGLKDLADNFKI